MIVDAYVNLNAAKVHKALIYSVREHGGLVLAHEKQVFLRGVKMTVQQGARAKIAAGAKKTVHAFLSGEWMETGPDEGWERLRYNPHKFKTFVLAADESPVLTAAWARLDQTGAWVIPVEGQRRNPSKRRQDVKAYDPAFIDQLFVEEMLECWA